MARVRLLLACVVSGAAGTAWAEVVPWLYDVEVVVASQSDADRRRAASAALAEALTRATGLREIPFGTQVDGAIRESQRYYVRYAFATRDIQPEEGGDLVAETHLEIHFERSTLLDLLRRTGLPVWSADRPTVLVWVVLERALGGGGRGARSAHERTRHVVSSTSVGAAEEVALAMHREARRRGIMLTFPLMDLEDRGLRVTDLRGRFWTAIMRASRRYARDLVLLGRVAANPGGGWSSHWELVSPGGEQELAATFAHRGSSPAAVAGEAVHRAADVLARRFAVPGGDLDTIALTVRGAQTVRGYAAVLDYLQSREYINRVDVSAIEPAGLHLRLHSRSARDQLVELLLMGGYLSESRSSSPTPPLAASGLELVWMGAR
ncbi:MAG: DUF2066 domain-containing protein [Gammaproteobacteria bacterium]|nr:DUF2066 domain-containing protein [Gammaproteobacteria bacterium]